MRGNAEFSGVRRRRAVLVAAVAACTAATMGLGLAGPALAVDPDRLRDGCVWRTTEEEAQHIQTCTFSSTSLGQDVTVQVRPSSNAPGSTEQGVYFLDGLGSNPEYSSWALPAAGAVDTYSTSYNLVMPAGGAGQWMTNWQQAPTGASTAPQWDTFVGEELPGYLADNFDIGTTNNAIVGVSMSGAPAVIIGLNHPDVFSVIRSYSGYYQTNSPFGWIAIPLIQILRANIDNGLSAMWGLPFSAGNAWAENDVSTRISEAAANGQTVILSSGNGIPTLHELTSLFSLIQETWEEDPSKVIGLLPAVVPAALSGLVLGVGLEVASYVSTLLLQAQTRAQGLPVDYHFTNGTHNWYAWSASAESDTQAIEDALASSRAKSAAEQVKPVSPAPATLAAVQAEPTPLSASVVHDETAATPAEGAVVTDSPPPSVAEPAPAAAVEAPVTEVAEHESEDAASSAGDAGNPDDQQAPDASPSASPSVLATSGAAKQSSGEPAVGAGTHQIN